MTQFTYFIRRIDMTKVKKAKNISSRLLAYMKETIKLKDFPQPLRRFVTL